MNAQLSTFNLARPLSRPVCFKRRLRSLFRACRVHHYLKNLLLFLVPATARAFELEAFALAAYGMLVFCLASSAAYLINDVEDREADRLHPDKRKRPFAARELQKNDGYVLSTVLALLSLLTASALNSAFTLLVASYLTLAFLYTVHFKRLFFADSVVIALLYCLRIAAGGAAANIEPGPWLLAFSFSFFLSLALAGRFAELQRCPAPDATLLGRVSYSRSDIGTVQFFGSAASLLTILILACCPQVFACAHPLFLSPVVALLACFWFRLWLLAHRRQTSGDLFLHLLQDKPTWLVALLSVMFVVLAA